MTKLLLATSNPHKLDEICAMLPADAAIEWLTLGDLDEAIPQPVEDQLTFEGNALFKARHYAQRSGLTTVADDSGLEVDALKGEPGVHSTRYSGITGPRETVDPANNKRLLKELKNISAEQRTARFVCAMALVVPGCDDPVVVRGVMQGRIIGPDEQPHGEYGFGYDSLFYLPNRQCTSAQLEPNEKNKISHRGMATRLIWPHIQRWVAGER